LAVLASAIAAVVSGPLQLSFTPLAWWKALHTNRDKCHFYFETSPNTKHKEKKVGWHGISYAPVWKKVGGHVPCVPHL